MVESNSSQLKCKALPLSYIMGQAILWLNQTVHNLFTTQLHHGSGNTMVESNSSQLESNSSQLKCKALPLSYIMGQAIVWLNQTVHNLNQTVHNLNVKPYHSATLWVRQ